MSNLNFHIKWSISINSKWRFWLKEQAYGRINSHFKSCEAYPTVQKHTWGPSINDVVIFLWLLTLPGSKSQLFSDIRHQFYFSIFDPLYQKWYFVSKIVLTYCEKKLLKWSKKTFEIWDWRPRICNNVVSLD